jgi:hypothetical protein
MASIPIPQWGAALHLRKDSFCIVTINGVANFYRIKEGHLELRVTGPGYQQPFWRRLPPEAVLQHVALQTPVATWLQNRAETMREAA